MLSEVKLRVCLLQTWPETDSMAVHIQGLGDNTAHETIALFFENEKRSGGGTIQDFFQDPESKAAFITFESREGLL